MEICQIWSTKTNANVIYHGFRVLGYYPARSPPYARLFNGLQRTLRLEAAIVYLTTGHSALVITTSIRSCSPGYHCRIAYSSWSRVRCPVERQIRAEWFLSRVLDASTQRGLSTSAIS